MTTPDKEKEVKKAAALQVPKGMRDLLPEETIYWEKVRKATFDVADFYGFGTIETPILESTDLFIRGVGTGTDIVEKEMYTLKTKGGDSLSLRPEFTAPVMRSFIENGMSRLPQPVKLHYFGPNFRHENPQAGRYREFYQTGLEIIGGESDPVYDAQVIVAAVRVLERLQIKNITLQINSIGCKVCRANYKKKLQDFYRRELLNRKKNGICRDCEHRMESNVLRLLDCKEDNCKEIKNRAPSILDSLCTACRTHFRGVLEFLEEVSIPYSLNPYLVRGLDYYNRTVFEFYAEDGKLALGGGGRYDYLAEILGAKMTPAVGVALGIDRIVNLLKEREVPVESKKKDKVFIVHVGDVARLRAFALIEEFYKSGVKISEALGKDSLQAQMKAADKEGATIALILGQKEVYEKSVIIRDLTTWTQETVLITKVVEEIKKRFHKH